MRLFRLGSPPQVRGTEVEPVSYGDVTRITPAGAGNSSIRKEAGRFQGDHPRRCGEQLSKCCRCLSKLGSPPQVRGTVTLLLPVCLYQGITPAGAGNRNPSSCSCFRYLDHPRRCGEQQDPSASSKIVKRITPAGAGNRLKRSRI